MRSQELLTKAHVFSKPIYFNLFCGYFYSTKKQLTLPPGEHNPQTPLQTNANFYISKHLSHSLSARSNPTPVFLDLDMKSPATKRSHNVIKGPYLFRLNRSNRAFPWSSYLRQLPPKNGKVREFRARSTQYCLSEVLQVTSTKPNIHQWRIPHSKAIKPTSSL